MSTHFFRDAPVRIALIVCLLVSGVQHALAQQQIRYPKLLEHGSKHFAAYVNEINGTPTWILDPDSLDFTLGSPMTLSSGSSVETAADAFVEDAKALFGIDPKNLEGPTITKSSEVWLVSYQQVFSDLRVLGAKLGLAVTRQGRLLAAGARLFPKVSVNTTPSLTAEAAMQAATGHASIPGADVSAKDELVILAIEENGAYVYGLAWEITVSNHNLKPTRSKTFFVDAHSGKILYERDTISHGGHLVLAEVDHSSKASGGGSRSGPPADNKPAAIQPRCTSARTRDTFRIQGRIALNYYASPPVSNVPLQRIEGAGFPYAKYSVKGRAGGFNCTDYSDADGNYTVNVPNEGNYTVTFYMESDTAFVWSWPSSETLSASCLEQQSFTIAVDAMRVAKLDYNWGWGIKGDGGLTSYALNGIYSVRPIQDYWRNSHNITQRPARDVQFEITDADAGQVTESDEARIRIGGAAAMSNELIMHEYTHLITDPLLTDSPGGPVATHRHEPVALPEAAADYFVADATGESLFAGPNRGHDPVADAVGNLDSITRQLSNTCRMVEFNCGESSHYEVSRILSGAVWSLRKTRIGPVRITGWFLDALSMEPDPRSFETVATSIHTLATDPYNDDVEAEFASRGISVSNAPRRPGVTCNSSTGKLEVTWTDVSSIEAGYEIERKIDEGDWQLVARVGANITEYTDTGASCGGNSQTKYSYRVASFSTFGSTNSDTLRTFSVEAPYPATSRSQLRASSLVAMEELQSEKPEAFTTELHAVYPNPFNPVTTISYALKEEEHVSLVVYDVLGRKVAVLVDGVQAVGAHAVAFDASRLPSGTYFVRMETAAYRQHRMMMLAK